NAAELWIMQNQIRELRTLLHQVNLRQAPDFVMEAMNADKFGKHDSGIVETECLVKIASQKILLHHFYYPFRSVHHWDLVPLVAARQTSSLLSPATLAIKCDHLGPHC